MADLTGLTETAAVWRSLLTGVGSLLAVLAAVMGLMAWIYRREGVDTVLFREAIAPPSSGVSDAYGKGCEAFGRDRYRAAVAAFETAVAETPTSPEAYHNLGLSLANLRDDTTATAALVRAGELYLERGDRQGSALVRRHLSAILARKQARENRQKSGI
jgi:tetratricopeptide (TPR) repeat protein